MARLYRPHIPLAVRCKVAERQVIDRYMSLPPRVEPADGAWLAVLLDLLADSIGCKVKDLRLDHDPPLALRKRTDHWKGDDVLGMNKFSVYVPAANDPEHLAYRPHGAEFEGSHDVKTRIRGDHGQYSDLTLIKRQRRREKKAHNREHNPKPKWAKRGKMSTTGKSRFPKSKSSWPKRTFPKRRK